MFHVPPWRWLTFLVAFTLCLALCQSLVYWWGSFPPVGMNDVVFIPISQIKRQRSREAKACFLWSQNQQAGAAGIKTQPSSLPTLLLTYHTPATDLQELPLHANLLQASYSPFRSGFSMRTQMSVHSAESRRMWWEPDKGEVKGSNTRQRRSGRRHGHRRTGDQTISESCTRSVAMKGESEEMCLFPRES